jgi:ABC-type branched-subunit amino acid transport system ATPase component
VWPLAIALVPETRALFGELSVLDNLLLGGYRFLGRRGKQSADDWPVCSSCSRA